MKTAACKQSGFTLVEIAIVLVIIGLLMGGALKGHSMIENAKVKALAAEMQAVFTMVHAYRDAFNAIPGDDADASAHMPGAAESLFANDGAINGFGNWAGENMIMQTRESTMFWHHVRLAGLATGNKSRGFANNVVGGRLGITSNENRPNNPDGVLGSYYVCSSWIPGTMARSLDLALDDGNGTTGMVFASVEAGVPVTLPKELAAYVDTSRYTVCMAGH